MKKLKLLFCIVIIATIASSFLPSICIAKSFKVKHQPENTDNTQTKYEITPLHPKFDCDPKMLIPGNTDIDPKILKYHLP